MTYTLANAVVQSTNLPKRGKTYRIPPNYLVIFANQLAQNRQEKGGKKCGKHATIVAPLPTIVANIARFAQLAIIAKNVAKFTMRLSMPGNAMKVAIFATFLVFNESEVRPCVVILPNNLLVSKIFTNLIAIFATLVDNQHKIGNIFYSFCLCSQNCWDF